MNGIQTKFQMPGSVYEKMQPAIWEDKTGLVHRAVGSEVHRDILLLWTACGAKDIPANAAYFGDPDEVTCRACIDALKESP